MEIICVTSKDGATVTQVITQQKHVAKLMIWAPRVSQIRVI